MKDLYFDLKNFNPTNYFITFFYSQSWCGKLNNIIINCILLKKNWWPSKFIPFPNPDAHTQKKSKKKKKTSILIWKKSKNTSYSTVFLSLWCGRLNNSIINCLLFFSFFLKLMTFQIYTISNPRGPYPKKMWKKKRPPF